MKVFILAFFLLSMGKVFANERRDAPDIDDHALFFPAGRDFITIEGPKPDGKVFGDLNGSDKRVRQIPTSFLAEVGIKKGATIQFVREASVGTLSTYTFMDRVFVYLHRKSVGDEKEKNDPAFNRFSIITSDDPKVIARFESGNDFDYISGFAYLGGKYKLQSATPTLLKLERIPNDSARMKQLNMMGTGKYFSPKNKLWATEVLGSTVLSDEQVIDPNDPEAGMLRDEYGKWLFGIWVLSPNLPLEALVSSSDGKLATAEWVQGYQVLFIPENGRGRECYKLYFFSKDKIEKVTLTCKNRRF